MRPAGPLSFPAGPWALRATGPEWADERGTVHMSQAPPMRRGRAVTAGDIERILVAGIAECRATPYNVQINRLGDVLEKMAEACGTGQMQSWRRKWSRKQAEQIAAEAGWR